MESTQTSLVSLSAKASIPTECGQSIADYIKSQTLYVVTDEECFGEAMLAVFDSQEKAKQYADERSNVLGLAYAIYTTQLNAPGGATLFDIGDQ